MGRFKFVWKDLGQCAYKKEAWLSVTALYSKNKLFWPPLILMQTIKYVFVLKKQIILATPNPDADKKYVVECIVHTHCLPHKQ